MAKPVVVGTLFVEFPPLVTPPKVKFDYHRMPKGLQQKEEAFLAEKGASIRAVVADVSNKVNKDFCRRLPNLEIVSYFGVGVDNFDLQCCKRHGLVPEKSVARRTFSSGVRCWSSGFNLNRGPTGNPSWILGAGGRSVGNQMEELSRTNVRKGFRVYATAQSGSNGSGFIRSKLAVFLSGGGSNFRALHSATMNNSIYGDVTVVISDKPGCKGCDYAREQGLPVLTFPCSKYAEDGISASDLVDALRDRGIDYVLLAGYLKLLPPELVRAYPRSILNIHPSLLPSFGGKGYYGMKVHEAVIKSGARFSGATIHFVDERFDTGPIVAQRIVPVLSDDTPQDLATKVLRIEHLLYSEVVAALCEDRIFWREDGVPLIRKSWIEAEYY